MAANGQQCLNYLSQQTGQAQSAPFACLLFLLVPASFQASAQSCASPPSGIIAWWPFDETTGTTAKDIIGGHDGVLINNPVWTAGRVGNSLRFDGTSQYVGAADSNDWAFGTNDFTIEFWANWDAPGSGDLVHAGDVFIGSDDGPGNQNKWFFALGGGFLHFTVYNTAQPPPNFYLVRAPFSPVVGQWYHLGVTKRGTLFTIYVNGVAQRSEVSESPIANAIAPLTIGRANEPFGGFMNGRLDEITVYEQSLTETQLRSVANAGAGGKCKLLSISTKSVPAMQLAQPYSFSLQTIFGQEPVSWSIAGGNLPPGLSLSPSGVLSGTPSNAGVFTFVVKSIDAKNAEAQKQFSVDVLLTLPPPAIRVNLTGTTPVPGRDLNEFAVIENTGAVPTGPTTAIALLDPWHTFKDAEPSPKSVVDLGSSFTAPLNSRQMLEWDIPNLNPGQSALVSLKAHLYDAFPLHEPQGSMFCSGVLFDQKCNKELFKECFKNGQRLCRNPMDGRSVHDCVCGELDRCAFFFQYKCPRGEDETDHYKYLYGCLRSTGAISGINASVLASTALTPLTCSSWEKDSSGPVDPNEKLVSPSKFIQPDQLLTYPTHFQNIGDIEARDVFVTDVLSDPSFDLSTLRLLTPGGTFDLASKTVSWRLLSRNLPPGQSDYVALSVRPQAGLPSGTVIRNKATIQFEVFPPLVTPEVVNIIDSTRPACALDSLPSQIATTDIPISWKGTDVVGEIDSYSVFVSENGGAFLPVIEGVRETSGVFKARVGNAYGFLCVAKDTAGNIEVQQPVAEATTTVIAAPSCASKVSSQVSIARGGFRLNASTQRFVQTVTLKNTSTATIQGPVSLVLDGLSSNAVLFNKSGVTACEATVGSSYVSVNVGTDSVFNPGEMASMILEFTNPTNQGITYSTRVLAGTGIR